MANGVLQISLLVAALGLSANAGAAPNKRDQEEARSRLSADTGNAAEVTNSAATGRAHFVRAKQGGWLAANIGASDAAKEEGSRQFLNRYGAVFGITNAASELSVQRVTKEQHGHSRVLYQQMHRGVPVFGAELRTHFDRSNNLIAASGTFVPGIEVDTTPARSANDASAAATAYVKGGLADQGASFAARGANLVASTPTLVVYRDGLLKGTEGISSLAWQLIVTNGRDVRENVFVDAQTGKVLQTFTGIHDGKDRRAYNGSGAATAPGPNYPNNWSWKEGDAFPTGVTEQDNMIAASGEIYDLFKNAFGRDSFDGKGARMDSIYNRGWSGCPNASWNGTYISFCPGTTTDDVTAHEWGHAYTEYTHGLIYAWQSGALNEAYSDIWGETVDRINGRGGDTPDNVRTAGSCTASTPNRPSVTVNTPNTLASPLEIGTAAFGAQTFSLTNDVVLGSPLDGCTAMGANVSGKIAFVDRGTCGFTVKVKNAQNAGAVGVVVGNSAAAFGSMGGADSTITIPSVMITQSAGTAFKAAMTAGTVNATLVRGGFGTSSSVRWLMGEDSSAFGGAIRDMYNPSCYGHPGKVSDSSYLCAATITSTNDQGGVHSNSGVPNHGYALIVDGGAYNGQNITGIGLTKAAHIYYRAQSVYQGIATDFSGHADAIEQSCRDLTGVNLNDLKTGTPSGEIITPTDCAQVAKAALAVELRTPVTQCALPPVLAKTPPAMCTSGSPTTIASDGFDGGRTGGLRWVVSNVSAGPNYTPRNFGVVNKLPSGRSGYGMFAADLNTSCSLDQSGLQRLESPEITVPVGTTDLRMAFDHWVSTEPGYDGGNLKISVNGGAWTLVRAADFIYNPYNGSLLTAGQGNSNPLSGQAAWSGSDAGSNQGSWGRSIINLSPYATAGAKVKLRFEAGNDSCSGSFGWYLDDVTVYQCPAVP